VPESQVVDCVIKAHSGSRVPTLSPGLQDEGSSTALRFAQNDRRMGARSICGWMRVGDVRPCYPRSENPDLGHPWSWVVCMWDVGGRAIPSFRQKKGERMGTEDGRETSGGYLERK
jgi:hypothetical protein